MDTSVAANAHETAYKPGSRSEVRCAFMRGGSTCGENEWAAGTYKMNARRAFYDAWLLGCVPIPVLYACAMPSMGYSVEARWGATSPTSEMAMLQLLPLWPWPWLLPWLLLWLWPEERKRSPHVPRPRPRG